MVMADRMVLPSDADHTGRDLGDDELALLRQVIESGTLNCTKGTQVKAFEQAFAARYGVPHARAVTSGTAACHAAIAAVDPEPGDEIITTSITDMGAIAPITEAHVEFIARAVRAAVRSLVRNRAVA